MTTATRAELPAPDAAVPGLSVALSEDADELVSTLLRPGSELVACRPCYLRYKPGQSCLVLYRLAIREASGGMHERLAHARLYSDGRAARIWSRGRIQSLAASVDASAAPLHPAAHVPAIGGVLLAYPVDLELPALVRLPRAEPVRYKPARKALLRCDGRFVKVYADDRGARAFGAGLELRRAGVPVAEPLRYAPRSRMLVHLAEPGEPLSALRGTPRYGPALQATGGVLARLHETSVHDLPLHSWREDLRAAAWAVGVARTDLAAAARRLAEHLALLLEASPREAVTAHGDFYDDQLVVTPNGPVVLDLDRVTHADPLLDVGTFLAHLAVDDDAAEAGDVLLAGYGVDRQRRGVLLAEAAALLKLAVAPFRTLAPGWPEEVERRLALAAERLREARPGRGLHGRAPRDPALPQLEALLDPERAGRILGKLVGAPVEPRDARIVRHRPGRRATLRYELQAETLYAKTYASRRAARVHRTLAAVAAARLPGVRFPEPVGIDEHLHLVVQRELGGVPAMPQLIAGDVALAGQVAEALHALHASPVQLERLHALDDELAAVELRISGLPARLAREGRACIEAAARVARTCAWRLRPIHRDIHPDQVLVGDGRIGLLDLDDAAMSEPAVDVANFLAHLRLLASEHVDAAARVDRVAAAFAERCAALDPRLDQTLVRALEATTLVRLACIHLPKHGDGLAGRLVACSRVLVQEPTIGS